MGRVGGQAYAYLQDFPFAVTADVYALGDLTALHEIGHVFGGAHAVIGFNEFPGASSSSKGLIHYDHVNTDNSWQTIMGGYGPFSDDCVFNGPYSPCERLNYFSNPSLSYDGVSLGSTTRNMKSWLDIGMSIVSMWRVDPVPVPNAPNPIYVNPEMCLGLNSINWTTQSVATEYKLYKSPSSSFTFPVLLYNGTNTFSTINVSSGTWYLRAQACNASGCSAYSNQVSASRISSCL